MHLSKEVFELLEKHETGKNMALKIGVALEEMVINISKRAKKNPVDVDVRIIESTDGLAIILRDNGMTFNPVEYNVQGSKLCITDGILLLKKLARNIKYSRTMGLNQTVIEL